MEQTFGYVTGCAWTNCVVAITSLDALPTLAVTLADCLAAVALTLFAALWLLAVAAPAEQRVDRDADEREHVEIFYLTNAMCYFVGWAWVSCLRALATLVARLGNWIAMFGGRAPASCHRCRCRKTRARTLATRAPRRRASCAPSSSDRA